MLAGPQSRQVEEVADAGKRVDGLRRHAIEIGRRVSEPLRHRASHLEMELAVGVLGDVRVHALDLLLEGRAIDGGETHGHLLAEVTSDGGARLDRQACRPPLRESFEQPRGPSSLRLEEFNGLVRVDTVRAAAIRDVSLVLGAAPSGDAAGRPPVPRSRRRCDRPRTQLRGAVSRITTSPDSRASQQLRHGHRLAARPIAEVLADQPIEIGQLTFRYCPERAQQVGDRGIGKAVVHEQPLLSAFDKSGLPEGLQML